MATANTLRSERLDARVTPEEKETIETAANLRGTSSSDFIRMAVKEAALNTIREYELLTLNQESRKILLTRFLTHQSQSRKHLRVPSDLRKNSLKCLTENPSSQ